MSSRFDRTSLSIALILCMAGAAAQAAPVATVANIDFSGGSASFGYMGQQFTFKDISNGGFTSDPVAVTTVAGAKVSSLSLFGPAQPTIYFDPIRGSGHLVFDASSQYTGFTNAAIQYSATPSFLGLSLALSDGIHYGYAQFDGTDLVSYAFESVAGAGIDAAGAAVAAVPEPTTVALMLGGLGLIGFVGRRRRS